MDEQQAQELLGFLRPEARVDVRGRATRELLALTGGPEGRQLLASRRDLLEALLGLAGDPCLAVAADAHRALVNLAAEAPAREALRGALPALLGRLLDVRGPLAGQACALLCNLSRDEASSRQLFAALQQRHAGGLAALLDVLCAEGSNPQAPLHHLGPLLCNLSQLPEARQQLLDPCRGLVQRLLPFTEYRGSAVCRRGVVGALRNCCFDYRSHEWLLSEDVDLLAFLLLPLAGPEEFPEDEMARLPLELQYLPPEKQREPDPDIRKMLLEAILLLTATKTGRQLLWEKGTYLVLRELHGWEADAGARAACEKLIHVLISDEPEAGMENLLEVEVPAEVEERLQCLGREEAEQPPEPGKGPTTCAEPLPR